MVVVIQYPKFFVVMKTGMKYKKQNKKNGIIIKKIISL